MEKNEKSSIFILNIDEEGRKIYTSQSDPSKRYMLDDDGNLTECTPDLLMHTIKMESDYELSADSTSNDGILVGDSDCIIAQLQNAGGLDMMTHLEHVSALDDTETLISEIDAANSSRRHIAKLDLIDPDEEEDGDDDDGQMMIENVDITGDSNGIGDEDEDDYSLMQHMDIREPLSTLKKLLEQRLGVELPGYEFWLQNAQMLESHKNLVDQCVQGEGLVQVNVQIQTHLKRINIADVLKPAEDYVDESSITDSLDAESSSTSANITLGDDIITAATTTASFQTQQSSENNNTDSSDKPQNVIKWLVDPQFRRDQERLRIPKDPYAWTPKHVSHWLQWAVRHFKLSHIKLMDWNISGRELCQMTLAEFQARVPKDPGDIFWTHLELLRKCKFVAVVQKEKVSPEQKRQPRLMKPTRPKVMPLEFDKVNVMDTPYNTSRSGNNGQIQLWQFLLELLTSKEYRHVIQWLGTEGEFKLISPELVAQLWGDRKNKPTMNYEKLSRALRYYYDGDMISKVHGKRFVYKFVCDLKQLLGYSALELARLVDGPTCDVDLS